MILLKEITEEHLKNPTNKEWLIFEWSLVNGKPQPNHDLKAGYNYSSYSILFILWMMFEW